MLASVILQIYKYIYINQWFYVYYINNKTLMLHWCQEKNEKQRFRNRISTHSIYCKRRKEGEHMQIWNLYPILNMNVVSSWFLTDVS